MSRMTPTAKRRAVLALTHLVALGAGMALILVICPREPRRMPTRELTQQYRRAMARAGRLTPAKEAVRFHLSRGATAEAYYMQAINSYYVQGNLEQALAFQARATALNPSAGNHAFLGGMLLNKGEFAAAYYHHRLAMEMEAAKPVRPGGDPKLARLLELMACHLRYLVAQELFLVGDLPGALEQAAIVVKVDPDAENARLQARLLVAAGQTGKALAVARRFRLDQEAVRREGRPETLRRLIADELRMLPAASN